MADHRGEQAAWTLNPNLPGDAVGFRMFQICITEHIFQKKKNLQSDIFSWFEYLPSDWCLSGKQLLQGSFGSRRRSDFKVVHHVAQDAGLDAGVAETTGLMDFPFWIRLYVFFFNE